MFAFAAGSSIARQARRQQVTARLTIEHQSSAAT
jgi:hypothetical protein